MHSDVHDLSQIDCRGILPNIVDTSSFSSFRLQTYRLAYLATYLIFAVAILMAFIGNHIIDEVFGEVGIGLFFAASLFSVLARRLGPFLLALIGLALLGACAHA